MRPAHDGETRTEAVSGMNANRPTLLVVDDEPEVLRSVHDLFRREFRVLTFERGGEAISALEKTDAPVILSDQRMPGMCGVDLLREAKRLKPETTRLLFTGYADIKAVIDAINEGNVFRYITKPWDPEEMVAVVRQAVEHHELIVEKRRLVGQLQDRNNQLQEADRLKRAFIQVASHELNTPVAVVLGMAELWRMAQGPNASPVERGWIERIGGAGKRLAHTVERMLKLLRTDRFDAPLDLVSTDLEAVLLRAVADVQPFLQARFQTVALEIDPELGSAEIDAGKIGDALTNLLVNAIKFTPDGGEIRVAAGPDGAERVRFRISDHGKGICQEDCKHLFEPFFTGYDTLHHSSGEYQFGKKGIGLGLWLVKSFVELHGGAVEVHSTPGEGSTFGFSLPRRSTRRLNGATATESG
jgi:signal transduction histidine kinase